jgi:glycerate dehydrogenase
MMRKIVFLDRATLGPQVRLRRPDFPHEWMEHERTAAGQAAERSAGAEIVITNKVPLRAETLEKLPGLRLIAAAATGTDNIDKDYCRDHGVAVANIRGYAVNSVPEHVFALILALSRSIVPYRADVLDGAWARSGQFCFFDHPIRDLHGATLAIIGAGVLGRRVAELGRAFGMRPLFVGRRGATSLPPGYVPWGAGLAAADVISLHCPLTAETRGMIGAAEFAAMARRPLLINTARGGLVDENALAQALEQGQIAGAGIDVAEVEPAPDDSLLLLLAKRPNVIVTPHTAWASVEAQQALADQLIDNIENFVAGRPSNLLVGG